MPTYIIRGWKEEALSYHEFAHREASRHNTYSKGDYYAKAEEFHFDAEDDGKAWKQADEEHPDLVGRRELLKVVPHVAKPVQMGSIEVVMNQSTLEIDPRRTPLRAKSRF